MVSDWASTNRAPIHYFARKLKWSGESEEIFFKIIIVLTCMMYCPAFNSFIWQVFGCFFVCLFFLLFLCFKVSIELWQYLTPLRWPCALDSTLISNYSWLFLAGGTGGGLYTWLYIKLRCLMFQIEAFRHLSKIKAEMLVWNQGLDICLKSRLRWLFEIKAETFVWNQGLGTCLKSKLGHLFQIKAEMLNISNQGWDTCFKSRIRCMFEIKAWTLLWNQG